MSAIIHPSADPTPTPGKVTLQVGTFPYGWNAEPAERLVPGLLDIHENPLKEQLPFPQFYTKKFTHAPRTIVLGSAKRAGFWETQPKAELPSNMAELSSDEQKRALKHQRRRLVRRHQCNGTRYMVFPDRSLRRVDKLMKKELSRLSPEDQAKFISEAMAVRS